MGRPDREQELDGAMVTATVRTIFAQPDRTTARAAIDRACRFFEKRFPKLVMCLLDPEEDVLAYYGFPLEHRRQIWSTNSLERLNKQVSRRCDVVGIFPKRQALFRLVVSCSRNRTTNGPSAAATSAASRWPS